MDLFSQSLVVPQNLRFYLHRLADNAQPSTNILRVNALNSTSANSGGLIIVRLPMALVDLNTFAMHFETSLTDGTVSPALAAGEYPGLQAILPKGIEGLISRLEVSVNGLGLLNLQQYNLLFSMLKESHLHLDKSLSRSQLQNEKDTAPLNRASTVAQDNDPYISGNLSTSSELITATCTAWHINRSEDGSSTGANQRVTVDAILTTNQPLPGTKNGVYEIPFYPPLSFFGINVPAASYLAERPQIVVIGPAVVAYETTSGDPGCFTSTIRLDYTVHGGGGARAYTLPAIQDGQTPFTIMLQTVQHTSYGNGATVYPELEPNNNNFHTIHDWLSFFKAQPEWLQTQMLGEIEVRITLADNRVLGMTMPSYLPTNPGSANYTITSRADYSLKNIYFSIRTCSFDNNFVDDMLHHKLSSGGEIEIPYDNYFNINQVQSGGSSQTRFSVNTQSLNKVVSCNRQAGFDSAFSALAHIPCGMGPTSLDRMGMVHKSPYFSTSASVPSGATYSPLLKPQDFNYWQYQINNAFIPNYKINPANNFFFNQEMYDMHNDWCSGQCSTTPTVYLNSGYQMGVALDFMDSEIPRLVSGVDTRGAVSVAYLNQDANLAGDRTDIFTCFTSILRVGANQQIQVVY
jgi:hypothetical protein